MTTIPDKFNIKDIFYGACILVTVVLNYATVGHNQTDSDLKQDKVNAIVNLQYQALSIQVGKLEIELKELQDKIKNK